MAPLRVKINPQVVVLGDAQLEDAFAGFGAALVGVCDTLDACSRIRRNGSAGAARVIAQGGHHVLVGLLKVSDRNTAARAASSLCDLAKERWQLNADPAFDVNKDLVEAGAVPPLVALLQWGAESRAAEHAVLVLKMLAYGDAGCAAIVHADGIPPLVALLHAGAVSEAAESAAQALGNLATNSAANQNAIVEAGAIPPLVAMLHDVGDDEEATPWAAENAALALKSLSHCVRGFGAIVEAGAIPPLVALLVDMRVYREWNPTDECGYQVTADTAQAAAGALYGLMKPPGFCLPSGDAILDAVRAARAPTAGFADLHGVLRLEANLQLSAAVSGVDAEWLELAIARAEAVQIEAAALQAARARLPEINGEAERQARRESFGLGALELPTEFVCPITCDRMRDPVVASDGRSYERTAIEAVLRGSGLSPLTREPLEPQLFANRNLKSRIDEYEEEVLSAAATAVAVATTGGGGEGSRGSSKRGRRRR